MKKGENFSEFIGCPSRKFVWLDSVVFFRDSGWPETDAQMDGNSRGNVSISN